MKKIAIVLGIILVTVCIGLAAIIYNLNSIVEKFRPQIEQTLSKSLRTPVAIGTIKASIWPTTKIIIENIKLTGAKDSQSSIGSLSVDTSIKNLLGDTLTVSEIDLDSPQIIIRRTKEGNMEVAGISLAPKPAVSEATALTASAASPSQKTSNLAIKINKINLSSGTITFYDELLTPRQEIKLKNINAILSELTSNLKGKISLTLTALSSTTNNINISGSFDLADGDIAAAITNIDIKLNEIDTQRLQELSSVYSTKIEGLNLSGVLSLAGKLGSSPESINIELQLDGNSSSIVYKDLFNKALRLPLHFNTKATATKDKTNFAIREIKAEETEFILGKLNVNLPTVVLPKDKARLSVKSDGIDLSLLADFIPLLKTYHPTGTVIPRLNLFYIFPEALAAGRKAFEPRGSIEFKDVALNLPKKEASEESEELNKLNGTISLLANQKVSFDIGLNYKDIPFKTDLSIINKSDEIEILPSKLIAFGGTTNIAGAAKLIQEKPFNFAINAQSLDLGTISKVALKNKPFSISGTLESLATELKANGTDVNNSLSLSAKAVAKNGSIKGVNIFAKTLRTITSIPGVNESLDAYIPERYKPLLSTADTDFSQLIIDFAVKNQTVTIHNFELNHSAYIIAGKGNSAFDGNLNISAQFKLTPGLTTEMVARQPKLALLQDSAKNIVFPIVIKRENGTIIILPDLGDLAERAAKNVAEEAATKALDKVSPGLGGVGKSIGKLFK